MRKNGPPKMPGTGLVSAWVARLKRAFALAMVLAAPIVAANPPWGQQAELTASDGVAADQFGWAVSVSQDTAVVGAVSENASQGAAYVSVRSGASWSQQQKLTASDGAAEDFFGFAVAVSGDTAVVGAWHKTIASENERGAAYVFVRSGGVWTQQQELTASDGAAGDGFGYSVSISGDTAVVGAPGRNGGLGAAYIFARRGGVWSQQQEVAASDSAANDYLGFSVSISGTMVVAGAPNAHGYRGAAYLFALTGGMWLQQQELTASDAVADDAFGYSVSLSGSAAVIGAPGRNGSQGAAYGFAPNGGTWSQLPVMTASDGTPGDHFGISVGVSGSTAAVGAYHWNGNQGAAYLFGLAGGAWTEQQELTAADGAANDYFGISVSVSGNTAAIGAVGTASARGSAYVFALVQPTISAVITAGAFGAFSAAAPGSWIEIYGSDLASTTRAWTAADFTGASAPTSLDGVQVAVAGQPAFVEYVSPVQVNAQLPSGIVAGSLELTVTSGGVTSAPIAVTVNAIEPGLLAPPAFQIGGNQYVAAQFSDGTYVLPAGALAGVNSRPAKPGETIVIYGVGFGPVIPDTPAGQVASGPSQLAETPQVQFAGTPAQVSYFGLAPGAVGLYQFNIVVPAVPASNLVPITFELGGVPLPQTLYAAVGQ